MKLCLQDQIALKDYLRKTLRALHFEYEGCSEIDLDSASCAGAIAELEILWDAFFIESPPSKEDLIAPKKRSN